MLFMHTNHPLFVQVHISEIAVARCNKSVPQKFVNDLLTAAYTEQYMSQHRLDGTSSKPSNKTPLLPGDVLHVDEASMLHLQHSDQRHPVIFQHQHLNLQARRNTDVIYFDFKKAFDPVSHSKLFVKLSAYGLSGNLLTWLAEFLHISSSQTE